MSEERIEELILESEYFEWLESDVVYPIEEGVIF